MKDYIFTITASGDRTNIMSSFPLWNKEMFLENVKKGDNYGRYRYGKIGGYVSLLKDMLLEEFEQVFSPDEIANAFTKEEITEIFRKEISLKYGEHAEKAKIKPLGKKELHKGHFYVDFSGYEWLYLGEVEQTTDRSPYARYQSEKRPLEINKGFGFVSKWGLKRIAQSTEVLKNIKRFQSKSERESILLEDLYEYETGERRGSWGREEKITVKIL